MTIKRDPVVALITIMAVVVNCGALVLSPSAIGGCECDTETEACTGCNSIDPEPDNECKPADEHHEEEAISGDCDVDADNKCKVWESGGEKEPCSGSGTTGWTNAYCGEPANGGGGSGEGDLCTRIYAYKPTHSWQAKCINDPQEGDVGIERCKCKPEVGDSAGCECTKVCSGSTP